MSKWYTVNLGAMTDEKIFNTYEDAELWAICLAITTGEVWHVQQVIGYAI